MPLKRSTFQEFYQQLLICQSRINSGKERTVDIPLSFIGEGNYSIEIYEDKPGEEMTNLRIRKEMVTSGNTLSVTMMANGGFCTIIE